MTAPAALGKLSKLAIGAASPTTYRVAFASFDHGCSTELLDTTEDASVGTLTRPNERVVPNRVMVRPRATLQPSLADWRQLLPWVLYGAETGTGPYAYAPANSPVKKYLDFANDSALVFNMTGVGVDRGVIRARSGGPVECELELVGLTYSTGGSFPAIAPNVGPPLLFKTMAMTINGTTTYAADVEIEVNNSIDRERFLNSPTLPDLVNTRREVRVTATLPVGTHAALWAAATGGAGVDVTATFTAPGGGTLALDFPAVKSPPESWSTPGNGESFFRWSGMVLGLAGTGNDEITATITPPS